MTRISQQTKDGLTVVLTIGVGLSTGFFVDAHSKHESVAVSLAALIAIGIAQLIVSFMPSQDMSDLEEYRKGEMASLKLKNAMSEQALRRAEEGKLDEAIKWQQASAGLQARRKQ